MILWKVRAKDEDFGKGRWQHGLDTDDVAEEIGRDLDMLIGVTLIYEDGSRMQYRIDG